MSGDTMVAPIMRGAERKYKLDAKRLRTLRKDVLQLSLSEFAKRVRDAGTELGEPNLCSKRLVQKWESGEHADCRPNYRRALQRVFGMPFEALCQETSTSSVVLGGQVATVGALLTRIDHALTEMAAIREVVTAFSREQEVRTAALLSRAERALSELTVVREQIFGSIQRACPLTWCSRSSQLITLAAVNSQLVWKGPVIQDRLHHSAGHDPFKARRDNSMPEFPMLRY